MTTYKLGTHLRITFDFSVWKECMHLTELLHPKIYVKKLNQSMLETIGDLDLMIGSMFVDWYMFSTCNKKGYIGWVISLCLLKNIFVWYKYLILLKFTYFNYQKV